MSKTVIVTGSANGIGKGIATAYANEMYNVIIADIDAENGRILRNSLQKENLSAEFVSCDVSDPDSLQNLVKEAVRHYNSIDILINNAGISVFTPPDELTADSWDNVINTNLRSSFMLTREAAKEMKKSGGGSVVNIASTRALMSEPANCIGPSPPFPSSTFYFLKTCEARQDSVIAVLSAG
jgi:NAD(P)-dependent dehydrogenase (short-subunit alcohol dehydrogenase family)